MGKSEKSVGSSKKGSIRQTAKLAREDVRCASDAVVRKIDTVSLFGFHDMTSSVIEDLRKTANHIFECQDLGMVTGEESMDALTRVQNMMTEYGVLKERLARALSGRYKRELRNTKSPLEVHVEIGKISSMYPGLNGDTAKVRQEKQEKAQAEMLEQQRKDKEVSKLKPVKDSKDGK